MNIIDSLIEAPTDADTIRKFHAAVTLGRLTEKQVAFGKAIIARPAIVAAETARRQAASYEAIRATATPEAIEARKAVVAAKSAPKPQSARQAKIAAEYAEWVAAGRPAK